MRLPKFNTPRAVLTVSLITLLTVSSDVGLLAAPRSITLATVVGGAPQKPAAKLISQAVAAPKNAPQSIPLELPAVFLRGDADGNGRVDMTDSLYTLSSLFLGNKELCCQDAADANDSGEVELTDAVLVLRYLFAGGTAIPAPFPGCGVDTSADRLKCEGVEACASETKASLALFSVNGGHVAELPPEILEVIPEGAKVRLRRVVDGSTRILEGIAIRFSEASLLIENSPPSSKPGTTAIARVKLGGSVRAGGGLVLAPTTPSFDGCNSFMCICDNEDDCIEMFGEGSACRDGICYEDGEGGVRCICFL
jgi:hypothetical protein